MTPPAFDFRKPPSGDLERQAAGWLADAARDAPRAWGQLLPFAAELRAGPVEATTTADALRPVPADAAYRVAAGDGPDDALLFVFPRPLVRALVAGLLGETPATLPPDRDLTAVEASLADFMLRELFLGPLERAWPPPDGPRLTAAAGGPPRAVWRRPGSEAVLRAELTVAGPFGEQTAIVILPRSGVVERLAGQSFAAPPPAAPPADRGPIEALVRGMEVDLSVVLGTADLTLLDLARLRAGDVVVLGQKVGEPLDARVAGASKFRVWPGAVGGRCAVQVHGSAAG